MERTTRSSRTTGNRSSRSRSRGRRERGSADERAVQSDSGMTMMKRERNAKKQGGGGGGGGDFCEGVGYDDTVLSGREMRKVNLSRDYLVRRESGKVQNGR